MFERSLSVIFVPFKNCFLYFPSSFKQDSTSDNYEVLYNGKKIYLSSSQIKANIDDRCVGMNPALARLLEIKEHDQVVVQEIKEPPIVSSLTISSLNKDDFEVLELFAENVQATLLDQIRVVNSGQYFVIWIGSNLVVNVIIEEVKPVPLGIITFLTEVVLKPPNGIKTSIKTDNLLAKQNTEQKSMHTITSFLNNALNDTNGIHENINKYKNINHDCILRIIPHQMLPDLNCEPRTSKIFNVFASKTAFSMAWQENSSENSIFCSISLLSPSAFSSEDIFARLYFLEDIIHIDESFLANSIFVSNEIMSKFSCDVGDRVILKHIQRRTNVNEIEIHGKSSIWNIEEKVKKYLADNSVEPMIFNADFVIEIEKNLNVSFEFLPDRNKYCIIEGDFLREVKYSSIDVPLNRKEAQAKAPKTQSLLTVSNFKEIINNVIGSYEVQNNRKFNNFLCTGKPGTGKTMILHVISERYLEYPHFVHTQIIECKKIKGKTVDSLHKVFTVVFCKLVLTQPSVLLLDDLDVLCENVSKGEETPNSIYYNRVSEMLSSFLGVFSKYSTIGIVATAESTTKLNESIYKSRGSHFFKGVCNIKELTKDDREQLLGYLFKEEPLDYNKMSLETDGFVIQDLVDFYSKTVFEAYKDEDGSKDSNFPKISIEHCNRALKNTTALSLQQVKFHESGTKSFEDIGGMENVKKVLIESLLWPSKYPSIFEFAPLRPQSGLLLYGPPGTGKTLVAGAAAKHCGIRLLSVKGPELLSKYIGASEQAVRDIFDKAQSAKPCILFFDEFDSLAPRRGHDNTGVTDRVVNQLLTRLDGIESLIGVNVVAATSRPDLLDPALLRPGRLDRQLYCCLPERDERLEILKVLAKNLTFSTEMSFEDIANRTEGYSGADLQSILYTAQLASVDYLWKDDIPEPSTVTSVITQQHLEEAFKRTKPSLTKSERQKYDRIYKKFQGGNVEDFKPGSKATLA